MPTFYIQQFGCRATQADGAAIERQLLDRGCTSASEASAADVVVINTCTVTASADAQARDSIRKLHAKNPAARVIVTGCYAQRAPEELAALPGVTWVVGNSHKLQIPDLVNSLSSAPPADHANDFFPAAALHSDATAPFHSGSTTPYHFFVGARHAAPVLGEIPTTGLPDPSQSHAAPALAQILTGNIFDRTEFLSAPVLGGESNHTRPTLKIQDGCDSRCSYCVIPFVRGKSRSLPPDSVIQEIKRLVGQTFLSVHSKSPVPPISATQDIRPGAAVQTFLSVHSECSEPATPPSPAREIVLSGINLGTYGRDLQPRVEFESLLRRILDETNVERLRISSIEPLDVTQDLIDLFAATDRIAQHFHMPLQSASNRILAAMHRWYRAEHYARRVELIHERLPHAAIGADVITGFPGETEADHAATMSFIESLPFTYLHVFSFSKRPGTKAASLSDEVPAAEIKRRARELRALSEEKSAAFRQSQLGRILRVLTLRRDSTAETDGVAAEPLLRGTTPALSTNYLKLRLRGSFPANLWLTVRLSDEAGNCLVGDSEFVLCDNSALSASLR
jgi:threonylcarbamoyladenosine tRNA methylthiotransferase MtaB